MAQVRWIQKVTGSSSIQSFTGSTGSRGSTGSKDSITSTAPHCALNLLGADELRYFHQLSPAKALQLYSLSSIPLGLDDPDTKSNFCSLVMDLFNGAKNSTITGEI